MKSGWQTSEFWAALLPSALSVAVLLGIVAPGDRATIEGSIVNGLAALGTLIAAGTSIWKYITSRTELKKQQAAGVVTEYGQRG